MTTPYIHDTTVWGPLEVLVADTNVIEILVNGHESVFAERLDGNQSCLSQCGAGWATRADYEAFAVGLLAACGVVVSGEWMGSADAALGDASIPGETWRLNAVRTILDGEYRLTLTLRRFASTGHPVPLGDLRQWSGALSAPMADLLAATAEAGASILCFGPTGSGKTRMLSALLDVTPASRRIAIVEDTPEIAVDAARHPGTLRLIASGDLDAHAAIRTALRTSPGRLVLGEVRDDAAYDFARAISHDRSGLATIHAASPQGALTRFATLAAGDPWCGSAQEAQDLAAGAIHLVVGLARVGGRRLVASVDEVLPRVTDGTFALAPIFRAEMLPGGEGQPEPRFAADPAWHMGARLRSVLVSARADADAVEAAVLAAA